MKDWKSLAAALAVVMLMLATGRLWTRHAESRGVGPVNVAGTVAPSTFSRDESAGLFVGVRKFPYDSTLTIPYAVDDAIDLAHRFALDGRVGLVPARRVVVALSGTPQKEESKERLEELRDAGAKITNDATAGDILQLLKEQAALAGRNGMLVLAVATHGFQQNGDAYVLGSTSTFGSPETALRTATLLEVAARVPRSLIFLDACRERRDARGASSDRAAAAPHIRRMARVKGQVIFYAAAPGQYAFDDPVSRNGVFTKAVLDGLNCNASAPGGTVLAETLHPYVDRQVRRWIRDNHNRVVNPATQVSMEGETRRMPLSECWRSPGRSIRVAFDGSAVEAYDDATRPLWIKDFGEPVVHAEAADLDADAFFEVVVGLRNRLVVIDREGKQRWSRPGDGMTLRTFTTGDLFEKRTNQIVAIWSSERGSRLSVTDAEGKELSHLDHAGELHRVAIGRATNMHAPRIIAASRTGLMLLKPKKLGREKPLWRRELQLPIDDLRVGDGNHDSRREIAAMSGRGGTTWVTFEGSVVGGKNWSR